jgi:hypothetical protein
MTFDEYHKQHPSADKAAVWAAAQQEAADTADIRDARRYRWLRQQGINDKNVPWVCYGFTKDSITQINDVNLDRAIDNFLGIKYKSQGNESTLFEDARRWRELVNNIMRTQP